MRRALLVPGLLLLLALALLAAVPEKALELRDLGLAQLENERPAEAEATFRELIRVAPDDPLGYADLAVALLRQQKSAEALAAVGKALAKAPGRGDLLAVQGEVLAWSGQAEAALAAFEQAAAASPEDVQVLYAAYRHAGTMAGEERAGKLAATALERLARLRPENLLVLLQRGARAVAAGDRAAATAAYLRVRELLWQAPPQAATALDQLLTALEGADLGAARIPSVRLENVLKVAPMYQTSLRELALGVQGVPVERFRDEPPPADFGPPVPVAFATSLLDASPSHGLVTADFDGDLKPDLARLAGAPAALEVRLSAAGGILRKAVSAGPAPGVSRLLAADLDNDGAADLLGWGPGVAFWQGDGKGGFQTAAQLLGLATAAGTAAAVLDFDVEGDLDLALAGGNPGSPPLELYRNALEGPLEPVGAKALPAWPGKTVHQIVASDLDRDGDLDLLLAHEGGLAWLDNLRQGRFADRTAQAGLDRAPAARAVASADLDGDGRPDLVAAGARLAFWRNLGGRFEPWDLQAPAAAEVTDLLAFDADNDGRLDLALASAAGATVLARRPAGFEPLPVEGGPGKVAALAAADLDRDGDLDLAAAGPAGLHRLDNQGGDKNHWLAVRLKGLTKGNSKNNSAGLGAVLEVRAGTAYQFREAAGEVTHFGLGRLAKADLLRVVWTNGVPQNRLAVAGDQAVVEEQLLKGSCPFLYTWDGERVAFVTDLLWASPLGLPVAPGVWAGADPSELVRVDGAQPRDGVYDLRITEELWEAGFFDQVRLWVVDAPEEVEVASNLRVLPGQALPEEVRASRGLRPVARAWDGRGRDVTGRVRARDEVYADGYRPGPYQGAAAPWSFTFDLGAAPGRPVRLHLDGWIFPADASLNLAMAQRPSLAPVPPRLEVETAGGWRELVPGLGFPAGKTKTMVIDTPPLPAGARRLRITTSLWLSWDRVVWTTEPDDAAPRVLARLAPARAELRYRGFSAPVRRAPNAPHHYDYARVDTASPWLPFPGRYTRYGDVRELLAEADDRMAILAAGDEMALTFDASRLPPPPAGFRRTVFLESVGYDKDADRNTWAVEQVEPLPFRAMTGYPFGPGEEYPDTPRLREYRERWLTREVK